LIWFIAAEIIKASPCALPKRCGWL